MLKKLSTLADELAEIMCAMECEQAGYFIPPWKNIRVGYRMKDLGVDFIVGDERMRFVMYVPFEGLEEVANNPVDFAGALYHRLSVYREKGNKHECSR